MLVPSGVTLNAMNEDDPTARLAEGGVIAVMTAVAVGEGVGF
jgi:hypothetical protein